MSVLAGGERLAIDGGSPVRATMLPYGHQVISDEDIEAVVAALRSDWLTTGPAVSRFEREFASYVGVDHAIAVSSGTAALHAAAFAAGVGPGDEVIVPALTFVATANCIRFLGGTVVFADVRPDALTLDPRDVERRLSERTKAIITVDFAGQPSDLDELMAIASRERLIVIEDAAHAAGAEYHGRKIGAIADMTVFSFHPVKQLTTGEGGMVVTDADELAARVRLFRNHGMSADARQREDLGTWSYDVVALGYNYRLSDLQCALGSAQLRRLPAWLSRRREIAAMYASALREVDELELTFTLADRASAWHLFVVRCRPERLRVGRGRVFQALRAENIGVNVHYIPVPWHTYYRQLGYVRGGWPVAEDAYERMVTLPLWAGMRDEDVADVVAAVRKVVGAYSRRGALTR